MDSNYLSFMDSAPVYEFDPQPDITAYELAQIVQLLGGAWIGQRDPALFITEHGIERHFKKVG